MYNPDKVPERMRESIDAYAKDHRPTGGFLRAVLSNDLRGAFERADSQNWFLVGHIVGYIVNSVPWQSWGSRDKYEAWIKDYGKEQVA